LAKITILHLKIAGALPGERDRTSVQYRPHDSSSLALASAAGLKTRHRKFPIRAHPERSHADPGQLRVTKLPANNESFESSSSIFCWKKNVTGKEKSKRAVLAAEKMPPKLDIWCGAPVGKSRQCCHWPEGGPFIQRPTFPKDCRS
jgi:hypothetical protein